MSATYWEKFNAMLPHQRRVVEEKKDLDTKISALSAFRTTAVFGALEPEEKDRLSAQMGFMTGYSEVLSRRIAAFDTPT